MPHTQFHNGRVVLHKGDCLEVVRTMPDNSIDSVCTDPPYALVSIVKRFGAEGAAPAQGGVYARASKGFMGKQWDTGETAFAVEFWAEILRVLKPGGHVAAFGGTRSYHRLACAIEDAGFEIRDQLAWVYGTGFPKSHDVSKGIDKARNEDIEPAAKVAQFIVSAMKSRGLSRADINRHFGFSGAGSSGQEWTTTRTDMVVKPRVPKWDQWLALKTLVGFGDELDAEVWRLNSRKGEPSDVWNGAEVIGEYDSAPAMGFGGLNQFKARDQLVRVPATDAARQWEGWGTALKPAWEPICLARKPLNEKTVAANVLRWGTGAINVDGCRVPVSDADIRDIGRQINRSARTDDDGYGMNRNGAEAAVTVVKPEGRFPANLCHDGSDEVLAAFPVTTSGSRKAGEHNYFAGNGIYRDAKIGAMPALGGSSGSAARFYYSAKASKADRAGSKHPTVKPVKLMQWLVRLITPPGGTTLDPFAGSGTTGAAAFLEGFNAVLIEREAEYQADIERRIGSLEPAAPAAPDLFACS